MLKFDDKQYKLKVGLAEMLKGGVIMDVINAEQAKIAEDAGAAAVMALERVPSDIRADGGVARMSDPDIIEDISAWSLFRLWPSAASGILLKLRCWKRSKLTLSMSPKS